MVGLLVGGRSWQLLSDDAAERQESPMAIGLGEHLPEMGQRDTPGRLQWVRGDWTGGSMSHDDPPCLSCSRRSWLQSASFKSAGTAIIGSGAEDRQG